MADPLSITASIIAVITAVECISKTLAKVISARNAFSELLTLVNEVSDIRIILNDFESHLIGYGDRPQYSRPLKLMATLLQRAKDQLLELDKLIEYQLLKPTSTSAHLKVSHYKWMKSKRVIERYRQNLRETRLNIIAQMTTLDA